jgi:hypothetical protein
VDLVRVPGGMRQSCRPVSKCHSCLSSQPFPSRKGSAEAVILLGSPHASRAAKAIGFSSRSLPRPLCPGGRPRSALPTKVRAPCLADF